MYFSTFLLALSTALVSGENCDNAGILVYEDLGCSPIHGVDKKCPIKYTCKGLKPSGKYCYFHGKSYKDGESVTEEPAAPPCHIACSCSTENKEPRFFCAEIDCPTWYSSNENVGCYDNDTLDDCCPVGTICPPFDDIEKCVVEGKEYKEGQTFYPSNTCLSCVCLKGFNGKFEEPFCKRRGCGEQLSSQWKTQNSCAPFYKHTKGGVLCCPDDWICPNGSEIFNGKSDLDDFCTFGNNTVKVGQHFVKQNFTDGYGRKFAEVKCECVIPPLMQCVNVE